MPTLSSDVDVCPAPPILASSLLELESDQRKRVKNVEPFQIGIKRLDANLPQALWTGGKVVGIVSDGGEAKLAEHLIATHLASLAPLAREDVPNEPCAFVIAPPNTSASSTIYGLLQARLATRSGTDPLQLLDTVQIMQYFDIAGLAESVSEASSCLHNLKSRSGVPLSHLGRHIMLVDGLGPALESMQRRSGSVQANALAASLLRSVTHLSRSHSSLLVLLNLEPGTDTRGGEGSRSAFSSPKNAFCGVSPGGMLQRTLLAGIDTVVLLHNAVDAGLRDGEVIVEVVKDRVGASRGHWAVWPRSA